MCWGMVGRKLGDGERAHLVHYLVSLSALKQLPGERKGRTLNMTQ